MHTLRQQIITAIQNNDTDSIIKIADEFGLLKLTSPQFVVHAERTFASMILRIASTSAQRCELAKELIYEIIARTGTLVDLTQFLELITACQKIDTKNDGNIPEELRQSVLERNHLVSREINMIISSLDLATFERTLVFLLNNLMDPFDTRQFYNLPIIHYIYEHEVIPTSLLLIYMSSCIE